MHPISMRIPPPPPPPSPLLPLQYTAPALREGVAPYRHGSLDVSVSSRLIIQ